MISIFLIILFSISHCNADVCYCNCCNEASCTPTLKGIVNVPTCTSSPCPSECQNKYPKQCTVGTQTTNHECIANSILDWIGEFNTTNRCNRNVCCCPGELLILSAANTDLLRIQCSLVGQCPPDQSIDMNILMPVTFRTQFEVLSTSISLVLSTDSNMIQIINPSPSSCNETAIRNIALSSTTRTTDGPSSSTTTTTYSVSSSTTGNGAFSASTTNNALYPLLALIWHSWFC